MYIISSNKLCRLLHGVYNQNTRKNDGTSVEMGMDQTHRKRKTKINCLSDKMSVMGREKGKKEVANEIVRHQAKS